MSGRAVSFPRSFALPQPCPAAPAPAWTSYAAGQLARCPCGRGFAEVVAGALRVRMSDPADMSTVQLRHRCKRCGAELDVQVLPEAAA